MIALVAVAAASAGTAERLQAAVVGHISQVLSISEQDVEVLHLGAAWESCATPSSETLHVEAKDGEDYLGPTELRVTVLDDGEICGRHRIKPRIARWVTHAVAAEPAAPGEVISLTTKRERLESLSGSPLSPEDGPYLALTALRAGESITTARARSLPDVSSGTQVKVEVRAGGLSVRCDGVLIGDADIGKPARARCSSTGQVLHGTLTSASTLVALGG